MKRNTKIKSQRKSGKKGKRYRDGRRERDTHTTGARERERERSEKVKK